MADEKNSTEAAPRAASGEMKTPDEWSHALGYRVKRREKWQQEGPSSEHRGAEVLHGWLEHAHHAGAPMQLTKADYLAALKAIGSVPLKPHGPAVSRYSNQAKVKRG